MRCAAPVTIGVTVASVSRSRDISEGDGERRYHAAGAVAIGAPTDSTPGMFSSITVA